jgi:Lon protease-like protein
MTAIQNMYMISGQHQTGGQHMERRRIIQLLAAGATSLWAGHQFNAASLLKAQDLTRPEPLLPLFPLDLVLFPYTNLPLHIFEERYKEMIQDCLENRWEFGMLAVQDQTVKSIGCTASVSEVVTRFGDGRLNILVRGGRRFEITELNQEKSYLRGKPQFLDDDATEPAAEELRRRSIQLYDRLIKLADTPTRSLQDSPAYTDGQLSYRLMAAVPADLAWKQSLLELRSEPERLDRVITYFENLIEYLEKTPDPSRKPPREIA